MTHDQRDPQAADTVRRHLVELVSSQGAAVLDDSRRVRAMLADAVPGATAETNLIGLALSAGVAARLRSAGSDPTRAAEAVRSAAEELSRTSSVQSADALWAVGSIADALGLAGAPADPPTLRSVPVASAGRGADSLVVRTRTGDHVVEVGSVAVVGRDPGCTITIESPAVSRQHARIEHTGAGWELHDVGSTQGTFNRGVATRTVQVQGETEVVLGQGPDSVRLLLVPAAARPPAPRDRLRPSVAVPAAATELPGGRPGGALGGGAPRTELGGTGADAITVTLGGTTRTLPVGGTLSVGREAGPGIDLVAGHSTVSRRHLTLEHRSGGWHLRDLGTTSGTWLAGERVTDVVLAGEQTFVLGDAERGDRLVTKAPAAPGGRAGSSPRRRWLAVAGAALAVAVIAGGGAWWVAAGDGDGDGDGPDVAASAGAPPEVSRDDLARATVYIQASGVGSGSGVIVDAERGLILTNAHVAAPTAVGLGARRMKFADETREPEDLVIHISDGLDEAAEPRFHAEVVAADGYLDLAVLKLTTALSGTPVDEEDLAKLTQVTLGDSDDVSTSDPISFYGYPAAADSWAPTYTTGVVSGTTQDDRVQSVRARINTTATSSFGNSGGLAVDEEGEMVGVPTWGLRDSEGQDVLSGIRPINFAEPLLEAAREGAPYTTPFAVPGPASARIANPGYTDPVTVGGVTAGCDGTGAGVAAPLAIRMDASGLPGGAHTDVAAALYTEQDEVVTVSTTSYPAELGADGCLTLTFTNSDPLPPGDYRLKIGVGGDLRVVYNKTLTFE